MKERSSSLSLDKHSGKYIENKKILSNKTCHRRKSFGSPSPWQSGLRMGGRVQLSMSPTISVDSFEQSSDTRGFDTLLFKAVLNKDTSLVLRYLHMGIDPNRALKKVTHIDEVDLSHLSL